ncbi:type II toxin-antitoxin system RelB/DinJ family antitoxin [Lactiplantibacillus mudanjiangensis]|uniref:Type II toxin-antitoxin system antitoxin, RelB/DinJ family [Lactobacillus sp.] n=1 Tax=Lactiplantibacillus mudanjiangensis TaxID=1296538 RepID=A0A660E6T5_9LACO|nr:type II toxin-antitoxin system RelB/DinJ family antitoxin [Lactiplantibacillus mudanjiangensis]VDG19426.1 type II toxin-antitoxin system antitoxin, RelB/DinJ family [Lactobacillus sp.] [Lactiplantibacillus mudanjiangensis]VDG25005.1 type II toxin-antitoxin system antitoxin, RelB/DinJ family [Lactobacillus sp.] [Lactiplantibacillus mudanjiangensis]VDG27995.1 type II toxin-antitoxin system antitoxin, RelB/DinJ family [Lactobacillus sp.] [Lactiplantibacillus mudanjiangensis]VDG30880.1 type II t
MDNPKNIAVSFRVNEQDKQQAALIYDALGLNLSTAFNMFLKQTIAVGGLPFNAQNPAYGAASDPAVIRQLTELRQSSVN